MAVADGNGTTRLCEMLFQLKPLKSCLSLCLSLSLCLYLLITCESFEQSASESKLSAVFFFLKNQSDFFWKDAFGGCGKSSGADENIPTFVKNFLTQGCN